MNPALAQAMLDAWQAREDRIETRIAMDHLVAFLTTGCKKKGGGKYTLADFLPERLNRKAEELEAQDKEKRIKAWFMSRATTPKE
jgi:hypothetical protein